MPKQRIVIDIDTQDQPLYTGLEGKDGDYEALRDFFEGLEFKVESIDFGINDKCAICGRDGMAGKPHRQDAPGAPICEPKLAAIH
jgi:hypothetical protein